MAKKYYMVSGKKNIFFDVPETWDVVNSTETIGTKNEPFYVKKYLEDKYSGVLGEFISENRYDKNMKIAIVIDDNTRPTPVAHILDFVVSQLITSGLNTDNVTIVVALGTHSPLDNKTLKTRVGEFCFNNIRVVQHDCYSNELDPVGVFIDQHEVRINPAVNRSDMIIVVSSILPHPSAGFGGGAKLIMPGVADFESIRRHHISNVLSERAILGNTTGNPFREKILEIAGNAGKAFSFNCVFDCEGVLCDIVAGPLSSAFNESVKRALHLLSYKIPVKVDVTATSSFPHVEGLQIIKSFSLPSIITKMGGTIIVYAPISKPLGFDFLEAFEKINHLSNNNPSAYIRETLKEGKSLFPEKPMDFNMAIMGAVLRTTNYRTILVSKNIKNEEAELLRWERSDTMEEAIELTKSDLVKAKVAIIPCGGLAIPLFVN